MAPKTTTTSMNNVSLGTGKGSNPVNLLQQLAREAGPYGIDESRVQSIYEAELANLKATAHIQDFLLVLVTRRVRAAFKHIHDSPKTPKGSLLLD